MQRVSRIKYLIIATIACAILFCIAAFSVSWAKWDGGAGASATVDGKVGQFYVNFPRYVGETGGSDAPNLDANTYYLQVPQHNDPDTSDYYEMWENAEKSSTADPEKMITSVHLYKGDTFNVFKGTQKIDIYQDTGSGDHVSHTASKPITYTVEKEGYFDFYFQYKYSSYEKLKVNYSDGSTSTTVAPVRDKNKESVKVEFSDTTVVFQLDKRLGVDTYLHIWKEDVNGLKTEWPGLKMSTGGDVPCTLATASQGNSLDFKNIKSSEVKGIILNNNNGIQTGGSTTFFDAFFGTLQANYTYTIKTDKVHWNDFTGANGWDGNKLKEYFSVTETAPQTTGGGTTTITPAETDITGPTNFVSSGSGSTTPQPEMTVRSVNANGTITYGNYVCVSRKLPAGTASLATLAYVNFEFNSASTAKITSFTVTRALANANGEPIGRSVEMRVYNDPAGKAINTLGSSNAKNNPYVALDFDAGTEQYYAMDVTVTTESAATFTLVAKANNKDIHTYVVASSFYLGFGDWDMREPVYICELDRTGLPNEKLPYEGENAASSVTDEQKTTTKSYTISLETTLSKGDKFKPFASASDGTDTKDKYFGIRSKNSSNYEPNITLTNPGEHLTLTDYFDLPTELYGSGDSDIIVEIGGKYRLVYSGQLKWEHYDAGVTDYSFEKLVITKLDALTERNTYTVTFDAATNGGKWSDGSTTKTQAVRNDGNSCATAPADPISNTANRVFVGWFKGADVNAEAFDFSEAIEGNTTLYAHYAEAKVCTITFNYNYTGAPDALKITTGNDGKLITLPEDPTRDGYNFLGWFTASGAPVTTSIMFTSDTTVYARWEAKPTTYRIVLNVSQWPGYDHANAYTYHIHAFNGTEEVITETMRSDDVANTYYYNLSNKNITSIRFTQDQKDTTNELSRHNVTNISGLEFGETYTYTPTIDNVAIDGDKKFGLIFNNGIIVIDANNLSYLDGKRENTSDFIHMWIGSNDITGGWQEKNIAYNVFTDYNVAGKHDSVNCGAVKGIILGKIGGSTTGDIDVNGTDQVKLINGNIYGFVNGTFSEKIVVNLESGKYLVLGDAAPTADYKFEPATISDTANERYKIEFEISETTDIKIWNQSSATDGDYVTIHQILINSGNESKPNGGTTSYSLGAGKYTLDYRVYDGGAWVRLDFYNIYIVTFDLNGASGTTPDNQPITKGGKVTKPTEPTWSGYRFDGWGNGSASGATWDFDNNTVSADVTLVAKWVQRHTVTFDANDGSWRADDTNPHTQDVDHNGTAVEAPNPPPEREGYTLVNWKDKDGNVFTFGTTRVTADITLYAQWTNAVKYKVTFNANGGTVNGSTTTQVETGTDGKIATGDMPTASRENYDFANWWTAATGGEQVTTSTEFKDNNQTVYAHWNRKANNYYIDIGGTETWLGTMTSNKLETSITIPSDSTLKVYNGSSEITPTYTIKPSGAYSYSTSTKKFTKTDSTYQSGIDTFTLILENSGTTYPATIRHSAWFNSSAIAVTPTKGDYYLVGNFSGDKPTTAYKLSNIHVSAYRYNKTAFSLKKYDEYEVRYYTSATEYIKSSLTTLSSANSSFQIYAQEYSNSTLLDVKTSAPAKSTKTFYLIGSFNTWKESDSNYRVTASPDGKQYQVAIYLSAKAEVKLFCADYSSKYQDNFKDYSTLGTKLSGGNLQVSFAGTYAFYYKEGETSSGSGDWNPIYVAKISSSDLT